MQAYNQAINDLDQELDHLKNEFEMELGFELKRHTRPKKNELSLQFDDLFKKAWEEGWVFHSACTILGGTL